MDDTMWIEGRWFSRDLFGQLMLLWLAGVVVAGLVVWHLQRKSKKSKASRQVPVKRGRRSKGR
jgi:hypothetical protein